MANLYFYSDESGKYRKNAYCHYRAISKSEPSLNKKLAAITFAKSQFFTPLQAADMVSFLARKEATRQFWGKPYDFEILLKYLVEGPKTGGRGIMVWYSSYVNEQGFVDLANDLVQKKLVSEKHGKEDGVPELRSNDAETDKRSAS